MHIIALPARCDATAVDAVLPELIAALASGPTTIDGSHVVQIGQAGLQLLVSARKSADAGNRALSIIASDPLRDIASVTGLDTLLFGAAA
ncbi:MULTISPECIES: STAS domain-containing protein [unclassified Sphingomonas]|jgi:anti-anti-sigma regulatory factor|uniref:STAS domain-containing protein n=1 Tax=unclassified Sphingomonas TaxID=196159 RepID=UPI00082E8659|nr:MULTISPECIES: STAS domain-containing protein [unclassified Sphingomonas]